MSDKRTVLINKELVTGGKVSRVRFVLKPKKDVEKKEFDSLNLSDRLFEAARDDKAENLLKRDPDDE